MSALISDGNCNQRVQYLIIEILKSVTNIKAQVKCIYVNLLKNDNKEVVSSIHLKLPILVPHYIFRNELIKSKC